MITAAVLLNYNDADTTIEAALRIEGYPSIDKIIVLDNASTDDSLLKLAEAFEAGHRKIELLRNSKNGGYGYGNNRGVIYAKKHFNAELVLIANPDSVFSDELVRKLREPFISDETVAAVGAVMSLEENSDYSDKANENGNANASDNDLNLFSIKKATAIDEKSKKTQIITYEEFIRSGWCERDFKHELTASAPLLKRMFKSEINFSEKYYRFNAPLIPVYAVHGSLLMVRADAFIKAGGYDEAMFLYMEEYALGARLKKSGFKTYLLAEHYMHEGSHSISGAGNGAVKRQRFRQASERIYYKKYLNASKMQMLLAKLIQKIVIAETKLFIHE